MTFVKPKKHLGQHFLTDLNIAHHIVDCLGDPSLHPNLLEIGPGTGVLTKLVLAKNFPNFKVIEIDQESVAYLEKHLPLTPQQLIYGDFLQFDLKKAFSGPIAIIGNFPYHISSQIFFAILDRHDQVQEVVGMVQKEVADRIAAPAGTRAGGILTVLLQAFYDVRYEFTVPPHVFDPPPNVQSAVISMRRNKRESIHFGEAAFRKVVKQAFNNRRKTLRNALKPFGLPEEMTRKPVFGKRAEELNVEAFLELAEEVTYHMQANP
jgi:16S rRNA (adenine1518-N6/adenine1519-N6)-dimethyltransferase